MMLGAQRAVLVPFRFPVFDMNLRMGSSPIRTVFKAISRRERGLLYRGERGHDAGSAASSTCPVPFPGIWYEFVDGVIPCCAGGQGQALSLRC